MVSIVFPLATNIKSMQKWGDNDISKRLKQSLILYDKVIIETGTYKFQGGNDVVLQGYESWSRNSQEVVINQSQQIENRKDGFITVIDGKTRFEKGKYKVEKKDCYLADFRTVDIISEIESGSYGKVDFLEYLDINRYENHCNTVKQNTMKDLSDREFAETVATIHGRMPTIVFLNNLNDSLAISHALDMPVAVDSIYASLLRLKTKCRLGQQFSVLEKMVEQIGVPDFSELSLEEILELRKDNALASFRNLISTLSVKLKSENNLNIGAIFTQELLKQIREYAPSRKRLVLNAFVGALSNIPCPYAGTITTIADLSKQLKEYHDFSSNWLSFILKANELKNS